MNRHRGSPVHSRSPDRRARPTSMPVQRTPAYQQLRIRVAAATDFGRQAHATEHMVNMPPSQGEVCASWARRLACWSLGQVSPCVGTLRLTQACQVHQTCHRLQGGIRTGRSVCLKYRIRKRRGGSRSRNPFAVNESPARPELVRWPTFRHTTELPAMPFTFSMQAQGLRHGSAIEKMIHRAILARPILGRGRAADRSPRVACGLAASILRLPLSRPSLAAQFAMLLWPPHMQQNSKESADGRDKEGSRGGSEPCRA